MTQFDNYGDTRADDFNPHLCSCGSGEYKDAEYDARGIFLTYVCDKCRKEKLSGFRPDVLTDPDYEANEPIEPED